MTQHVGHCGRDAQQNGIADRVFLSRMEICFKWVWGAACDAWADWLMYER